MHGRDNVRQRVKAAIMSVALVASQFLGLASPFAEKAMAAEVITFANGGTATVNDDGSISGVVYVSGGWADSSGYYANGTMPDGQEAFVGCYNSLRGDSDHRQYSGPCDGAYSFTAYLQDDGSYFAIIDSSNASGPCAGAYYAGTYGPYGYIKGYQTTYLAGWRPILSGKLKLKKTSGNEAITSGNECYSLAGATYGVYSDEGCSNEVATLTTGEDGASNEVELNQGTYWVKEKTPGKGYALDEEAHRVDVQAGQTSEVTSSEPAKNDPFGLYIKKQDMDGRDDPQGDATLEGAEFTVSFYAVDPSGVNGVSDLNGKKADRTWVIKTVFGGGSYHAYLNNECKVSGDDWYAYDDEVDGACVPLGVMTVTEKTAPQGYDKTDGTLLAKVVSTGDGQFDTKVETSGDWGTVIGTPLEHENGGAVNDQVVKGSGTVKGLKVDAEHDRAVAQGAATLEGAEVTLYNRSANPVIVGGTEYAKDAEIKTVSTSADGGYDFGVELPFGTYEVKETKASKGYLLNSEWSQTFSIREDGQAVDLTDKDEELKEQVARGDFKLDKIDGFSQEEMAGVPFLVTSTTTGESHVVVSDANGIVDTTSAHWRHTDNTNASDAALEGGKVADESKLTAEAGVWFSGAGDEACAADDSRGALPYDTYKVEELRCSKNQGKDLVSFGVTVTSDGYTVDKGTKENADVNLGTTLTYLDGKVAPADKDVKLTDTVQFQHVAKGDHKLHGELHAVDEAGRDLGVVATADKQFRNDVTDGTATVDFMVDLSGHQGHKLVAFEYLDGTSSSDSKASHEDLADEGQTVLVPQIGTEAKGDVEHDADASKGEIELTDTVSYRNLEAGRAYTMRAELHRQQVAENGTVTDGGVVKDADGKDVTAEVSFRAEKADGTVDVKFSFSNPGDLAGQTVVAFESLRQGDETFATHADITDEGQSVRFPKVETTLKGDETGDHDAEAKENVTVTDTVHATNLTVGKAYKVSGTLHVKTVAEDGTVTDGGELKDAEGNAYTAEKEFTADGKDMDVELSFTVDASQIAGQTVVAFETLSRDGTQLGVHADITDEDQSVHLPKIGTNMLADATGAHEAQATVGEDGYIHLTDAVGYSNLIAGKEYKLTAEIHRRGADGKDAGALTALPGDDEQADGGEDKGDAGDQDNHSTAPQQPEGQAEEAETFGGVALEGADKLSAMGEGAVEAAGAALAEHIAGIGFAKDTKLCFTVKSAEDGKIVGILSDMADGDQAATVGHRTVTLTRGEDGKWVAQESDVVGGAIARRTRVEKTFTPQVADGSVDVKIKVPVSEVGATDTLVAYEYLTCTPAGEDGKPSQGGEQAEVARHEDITDEGQSVHMVEVRTIATDKAGGDHDVLAAAGQTVTDRVEYKNLVPGREYKVSGTMHIVNEDGSDGGTLKGADGKEVTGEATFTPEQSDGFVDVELAIDASQLAGKKGVVFEDLYQGEKKVATHSDLTDESQTVTFTAPPAPETPATPGTPGDSAPMPQTGVSLLGLGLTVAGAAAAAAAGGKLAWDRKREASDDEETSDEE